MALDLPMFSAMLKAKDKTPYDYYKNFQQALIDEEWHNTTTLYTIQEQDFNFEWEFHNIQVHLNHAIATVTSGTKNGDDFRKINFRNLDHDTVLGLYYHFDNNYYITTFTDEANRLTKDVIVRRCNNALRWIDKNGNLKEYPCVLSYDAASPQNQIDNDIITPNNSLTVIIQGNDDTRTIYTNQRFMINNRPFKIAGYNDALMDSVTDSVPNILYFDIYLDEESPYDDKENGIANNSEHIPIDSIVEGDDADTALPRIKVEPIVESLRQGRSITMKAVVLDENGDEIENQVFCIPSGANSKNYILEDVGNNEFKLTNKRFDENVLNLKFISGNLETRIVIALKALF